MARDIVAGPTRIEVSQRNWNQQLGLIPRYWVARRLSQPLLIITSLGRKPPRYSSAVIRWLSPNESQTLN